MTKNNEDIGKGQASTAGSDTFEFPPKLKEILTEHHLWLESQGKDGKKANLSGYVLSGLNLAERDLRETNLEDAHLAKANLAWTKLDRANLSGADLQEADLSRASLQGADLSQANLGKADLTAANFRNAKLLGANFQESNLLKTDFRDADLQDAKLVESQNLLSWQLAGANLTCSELPATVGRFEELGHAGEITKTTATLLWTLLTGCLYACLTVATTTDASFYVSAATLKLPIIEANIPTWAFFILAPIVLLGWYFYFLLNLQRLWEALITLPALFPDGMRLDQKASPWFITGLVCSYFPQLQTQKPAFLRTQKFLSLILVWWIVPVTLIFVWINYLKARFWPITLVQILAISLACYLGLRTWQVAKATLQAETPRPPRRALALSVIAIMVLSMLSVEVINLVPPRLEKELVAEYESQQKFGPISYGLYGYYVHKFMEAHFPPVGRIVDWLFSRPFVNLDFEEVSIKPKGSPEDWDKLKEEELARHIEKVKGAKLRYTNLRHGRARKVFLTNAKLENANLAGSYLYQADLRNADISKAYLFNAFLAEANLQGADLHKANLKGVNFYGANLRGVKFEEANFSGVELRDANIERADFRKAQGLTKEQIRSARGWPLAFYDPDLLKELGLPQDHNQLLGKKDFSNYALQKANLAGANLRGVDLDKAILKGANLKGADLTDVKNLTWEQLKSADYDKNTRLPDYLK